MKPTNIMLTALILLVLIAVGYFIFKPKPQQKIDIANEIKKQNDSVAVISLNQPDTAKLRKLEALKIRIATARYEDSVSRTKNK